MIISFDMLKKKKTYLSFWPKKCYKKTNNTTKYIKMEFISSKTFKERNRKRESSTFFLFGRIYFVRF